MSTPQGEEFNKSISATVYILTVQEFVEHGPIGCMLTSGNGCVLHFLPTRGAWWKKNYSPTICGQSSPPGINVTPQGGRVVPNLRTPAVNNDH